MRKPLPIHTYTQINTNDIKFLIQNVSHDDLLIYVGATKPADDADYDYILSYGQGISGSHLTGLCWGKPEGKTPISVSVTEG